MKTLRQWSVVGLSMLSTPLFSAQAQAKVGHAVESSHIASGAHVNSISAEPATMESAETPLVATSSVDILVKNNFADMTDGATVARSVVASAVDSLPEPKSVVTDRSIPASKREAMLLAARRYWAFWDTGDVLYANAALAPDFVDRTLPPGRPQGRDGPLFASKNFRTAVPDLHVEVEEMLIVGDRVIGRLRFTGHFTGLFGSGAAARQGDGRAIEFIATDIYRIVDGRIAENWHLEDNLTLLQQLGAVGR
jgi:predicted ester cyclase